MDQTVKILQSKIIQHMKVKNLNLINEKFF
jgi:hypothetical protein